MGQKVFDQAGWLSGGTRTVSAAPGETPPPSPIPGGGNFRTFIGATGLPQANWGTAVTPDTTFTDSNGANYVGGGGYCSVATSVDSCFYALVTGGSQSQVQDSGGDFRGSLWGALFNDFADELEAVSGGLAEARTAVRTGRWRGIVILDDFISARSSPSANGFAHAVPYEEIEAAALIGKTRWPWMPLLARGVNTYLRSTAAAAGAGPRVNGVRQYQYLDAGWGQFRPRRDGDAATYYQNNVRAGLDCAIGLAGGLSGLRQGKGPTGNGWSVTEGGCSPAISSTIYTCSPAEIREAGFAALANPSISGWNAYAYFGGGSCDPSSWYLRSDVQAAFQDVLTRSVGRPDAALNVRGDLTPP